MPSLQSKRLEKLVRRGPSINRDKVLEGRILSSARSPWRRNLRGVRKEKPLTISEILRLDEDDSRILKKLSLVVEVDKKELRIRKRRKFFLF